MRSRPDDAHFAAKHIEKLRQLSEARLAQEAAEARDPVIPPRRNACHGDPPGPSSWSEFEHRKQAVAASDPMLPKQGRARRFQADQDCDDSQQRRQQDKRSTRHGRVEKPLDCALAKSERATTDQEGRAIAIAIQTDGADIVQLGCEDLYIHVCAGKDPRPIGPALRWASARHPLTTREEASEPLQHVRIVQNRPKSCRLGINEPLGPEGRLLDAVDEQDFAAKSPATTCTDRLTEARPRDCNHHDRQNTPDAQDWTREILTDLEQKSKVVATRENRSDERRCERCAAARSGI